MKNRRYRNSTRIAPEDFDFYKRICSHVVNSDYRKELNSLKLENENRRENERIRRTKR